MKVAVVMWPDTFEYWHRGVPLDRQHYLNGYDRERSVAIATGGSAGPSRSLLQGLTLRSAQRVVAIREEAARWARRELRHPDVAVWPTPFRSDLFAPGDRGEARRHLGLDPCTSLVV